MRLIVQIGKGVVNRVFEKNFTIKIRVDKENTDVRIIPIGVIGI